jgi:Holliday junction resolvase RusA-like endonuclease
MQWSFIIDITDVSDKEIYGKVEEKAKESILVIGKPKALSAFKVDITFFQAKDRWQKDNPQIPREDIGRDLDNLIKPVFDGLGPIIGYRKKWGKEDVSGKLVEAGKRTAADSKIIELSAKKVNSGSKKEFLSIRIEDIAG